MVVVVVEETQMSTSRQMDSKMCHSQIMGYYSVPEEGNSDTCYNMDRGH